MKVMDPVRPSVTALRRQRSSQSRTLRYSTMPGVELSSTNVNTLDTDPLSHAVEQSLSYGLFGLASMLLFDDAYRGLH
jgi:hypothetical protein